MSKERSFEISRTELKQWIDEIIMAHYHTCKHVFANQRKDIQKKSILNAMTIFCYRLHMQMTESCLNDMGVMNSHAGKKFFWWNDRLKELLGELDD